MFQQHNHITDSPTVKIAGSMHASPFSHPNPYLSQYPRAPSRPYNHQNFSHAITSEVEQPVELLDFRSVIEVNKRQHTRIQNLMRANNYLKSKLQQLSTCKSHNDLNVYDDAGYSFSGNHFEKTVPPTQEEDYQLISIGTVDKVTRHDLFPTGNSQNSSVPHHYHNYNTQEPQNTHTHRFYKRNEHHPSGIESEEEMLGGPHDESYFRGVSRRLDIHPSRKRFQGYRSRTSYFAIDEDEREVQPHHHNYQQVPLQSLLSEERDLRPATFIRDIEAKTRRLEEEKAAYHLSKLTL